MAVPGGLLVGTCPSLRQANLEGASYDVALLDLAMPGMDGLELARAITADPALAATPLLLLSSMPVEAGAATDAGFVASLTKPVRLSQLYDHMVRAVGRLAAPAVAPRPPRADGLRGHVLVVEDQSINQTVARGILASLGYGCDVAANGIEALEAMGLRRYDAVLMDCHMPEMDGYKATAEIRRREEGLRRTPIIAMTAAALVEDHNRCLAAGMDHFVSKPVTAKSVDEALSRWVQEQPTLGTLGPPRYHQPNHGRNDGSTWIAWTCCVRWVPPMVGVSSRASSAFSSGTDPTGWHRFGTQSRPTTDRSSRNVLTG